MNTRKKVTIKKTVDQYTRAALAHKKDLFLSFFNPVGSIASNVGVPFFATQALASIFTNGQTTTRFIYLTAAAALVATAGNRIGFAAIMRLQARTMATLNQTAFNRVISRGVGFHVNTIGGKVVADLIDYTSAFSAIYMTFFTNGSTLVTTTVIGLIVILLQSWQLGLFIAVVAIGISTWAIQNSLKRAGRRAIRHEAQRTLASHLSDSIVNAPTIKIFAQEEAEKEANKRLNARLLAFRTKDWLYVSRTGNNRIAVLMVGVVSLLVLLNMLSERSSSSSLGASLFAFSYTMAFLLRLFEIDTLMRTIEENFLRAAPMTELLEEPIEVKDKANATELNIGTGTIQFNDVSFKYIDDEQADHIFQNFSLKLAAGEKIGLVGPSGGGKSTLTKMLLRFEDVQSGSIEVDDQDTAAVTQTSLRSAISYVPQEPLLFHRTIAENIAYGKPRASIDEIKHAAEKAKALSFIQDLPKGFDTIVGERGVKLSGGQRQRVAIARAILKDAPIVVLDEATSALDSESEQLVQKSIAELMKHKTAIVIAHRLSTIQKMDRIIVLENGIITEQGTHSELSKKRGGHYARLWKHQSGGFLETE